jgi:phosphatidylglycerol:prolipoprotein diacylglycerol transferase
MYPTLFTIGDFSLSTYEAAMTVAFLLAIFLAYRRAPKEGIDQGLVLDVCLWIVVGSLVGARLLFILTRVDDYMRDPIRLVTCWKGGLVYYGGLIGGALATWVVLHRRRAPFFPVADLIAPYLMLGYAVHRTFGCFLAGCCFGRPTDLPWGVVFPPGSAPHGAFGDAALHPTQLYTAIGAFAIFGFLLWLRRRKPFDGAVTIALFFLYAISRFVVEAFRGDAIRGHIGPLSTSQIISVGTAILAAFWFAAARRAARARAAAPPPDSPATEAASQPAPPDGGPPRG